MMRADVAVVGIGLAGLSCAVELTSRRRGVLLLEADRVVGGRTASWDEDRMMVESGFHRVLGFYEAFPELLRKAGINVDDIVCWEDEVESAYRTGATVAFSVQRPYTIQSGP